MPRMLVALMLVSAGTLSVAASVDRWWSACGLRGFDTPACLAAQDHAQDHLLQGDLSLVLLAAAVGLLPLLGGARSRRAWVASGALALPLALLTVPGLPSGLTLAALAVWLLAWPVPLAHALRGVRRRWLLVALLTASTPLAQAVLVPVVTGYASYDTAPWSEAVLGLTLIAAAGAMTLVGGPGPQDHDHHDDHHRAPRDAVGHAGLRRPRTAAHG